MLLIVAIAGCWIALSLYRGLGADAALHRQVLSLQAQTQGISRQVAAEREELKGASSSAAQAEIARSEGLVAPGEKVYALENPVQAAGRPDRAGPGPAAARPALTRACLLDPVCSSPTD